MRYELAPEGHGHTPCELRGDHAETSDAAWFDPDRISELRIHPAMRLRMGHALSRSAPYIG
jgi:hypothetical protein